MKRVAVILSAFAIAGCSGIPSSGPVVQGQRVDVVRNDGYVRVIARPPTKGIAPDALVRGFLTASASVADGDDTARAYLTPKASGEWNPQQLTVVYDAAALVITVERDDTVRIAAPKLGSIDARHRYTAADAGATVSDVLQLRRVDGEWRIDSAPQALYLGEGDIARSFRAHPLYFFDPQFKQLVPEFVLLPVGQGDLPTQLIRALLSGPSTLFGGALVSALPKGATLANQRISLDGVTATVPLDRSVRTASAATRDAIVAQIVWTLASIPEVVFVRITVDGNPLGNGANRTEYSVGDYLDVDPEGVPEVPTLVYLTDNQIVAYANDERSVLRSGDDASAAAASRDGELLAIATRDRKLLYLARGTEIPRPIATGRDLAKPQFLASGTLWFVDREARGGLRTWDVERGLQRVITGLPASTRILDFAIAPDNTRIAVVVSDGVTTTLRVGVIKSTGGQAQVVGLTRVEQRLTAITAVAWESLRELVVLGSAGAVAVQPIRLSLPLGSLTLLGGPANAVSMSVTVGEPIVVGDQGGQLWQFEDGRWNASVLGSAPNYMH